MKCSVGKFVNKYRQGQDGPNMISPLQGTSHHLKKNIGVLNSAWEITTNPLKNIFLFENVCKKLYLHAYDKKAVA